MPGRPAGSARMRNVGADEGPGCRGRPFSPVRYARVILSAVVQHGSAGRLRRLKRRVRLAERQERHRGIYLRPVPVAAGYRQLEAFCDRDAQAIT